MLEKHVSLLHGVARPLEINIHRQMTVRLAIVTLNSILSLSLSLSTLMETHFKLKPSRVFNLDSKEDVQ